jgi:predicted amidohydrolase YtcJ
MLSRRQGRYFAWKTALRSLILADNSQGEPSPDSSDNRCEGKPGMKARAHSLTIAVGCLAILSAEGFSFEASRVNVIYINARIYEPASGSTNAKGCFASSDIRGVPGCLEAIAIRDHKIVAVGPTKRILERYRSRNSEIIDLDGHFATSGFNDAHVHLASAGFEKLNVDLVGARSLKEMQERIAARAESAAESDWIVGRGWDHTLWETKQLPTRMDLDKVTAGHPAIFTRVDGHIAVASSIALAAAGIDRNTQDPPGGKFDRLPSGELTGIARETAAERIYSHIPRPTLGQRRRALELATQDAIQHGLTSVQDYSSWDDFLALEQMEREGALPLRVTEWLSFDDPLDVLEKRRAAHPADDPMLHTGMLKGFMDGSLGSRTAALFAPYADDRANSGIPQYDQEKLNKMTVERAKAGFQIGFHAIGDRAVSMALDAFAAAESAGYGNNLRFRIEHAQVVAPRDFERFHQLGVIASMQPNHLLTDMHWAEARLGPERTATSYAWKSFLDHDVVLAFGTDYPVEPVTPFRGMYAAVTRTDEKGKMTYHAEEKLTLEQALQAYTVGAAYADFAEQRLGRLSPDCLADFVVLDRDITRIPADQILDAKVLRTVVGGKTVWEAK